MHLASAPDNNRRSIHQPPRIVAMPSENPYNTPLDLQEASAAVNQESSADGNQGTAYRLQLGSTFTQAYLTSLSVGLAVVPVWIFFLLRAAPPGLRRTRPPDIVELVFIVLSTCPSLFTCFCFSLAYCSVVRTPTKRQRWPAILFGCISGLIFNAITTIEVIEHFFQW